MKFLKKLFKKKPKDAYLKYSELDDWFKQESKDFLKDIDDELENMTNDINIIKKNLRLSLKKLENASLINPNIPNREKQVMQGNKDNYINKTSYFLDHFTVPKINYEQMKDFSFKFEEDLTQFNNTTARAYFILTNYFDTEMKEIASYFKKIETHNIRLRSLLNEEKITAYKKITSKIKEIKEVKLQKKKLDEEIKKLDEEYKNAKPTESKLNNELLEVKKSPDFNSFNKYQKRKEELNEEISQLKFKLNNKIKLFDKALRKFLHGQKDDFINLYMTDPIHALSKDQDFKIINIIDKIKLEISAGHLDFKEKQKEKMLSIDFSKEYLIDVKSKYNTIKKQIIEINQQMDKMNIMINFKDLQYKIEHNSEKLDRLKEKISEEKNILSHLNLNEKTKKLEKKLSIFSNKEVKII